MLRSAAIEAIRKYIDREGPQTVKNYSPQRQYIHLRNDGPYLVIDEQSATLEDTALICSLATALSKIVPQKPAQAPKQIPNIRLPYKDE